MVPKAGLEPARAQCPTVFETVASANSATSAPVHRTPSLPPPPPRGAPSGTLDALENQPVPESRTDLEELVIEAERIVATIQDPEMRRIAFGPVLDRLLAGQGANGSSAATAGNGASNGPGAAGAMDAPADGSYADAGQRADSISRFLNIDPAKALDLFDLSGEEPELQVHSARIPTAKAEGTRKIALLLCSGRTALGLETTTRHVKEAADRYGRYDAANFMDTLTTMTELAVRGRPQSSNRLIRLRVIGQEAAGLLAASL